MGIMFAVLTALLLAFANFFLKKSFRDFSPSISFFIFAILTILLWVPLGLILGVQFDNPLLGIIVGLVSATFAQGLYIYILEKGNLSITSTILSSFSIYTILLSVWLNGEKLTPLTFLFIALTIIGTLIVSLPEKFNKKELTKIKFILWAVFGAMLVGASDTLSKYYITNASIGSFLFYVSFAQLFVSLVYLKIDSEPLSQFADILKKIKEYKFALLGSFFAAISTMCLFLSFNFTLASIASPISASAPVLIVLLSLIFLKEKLTRKNWIGLTLVLISIIAIGFLNP